MEKEKLIEFLKERGYYNIREIPGRGICGLYNFIYTTGLLVGLDEVGYKGRYCYREVPDAYYDIRFWDGIDDPKSCWIKYKGVDGERDNTNNVMNVKERVDLDDYTKKIILGMVSDTFSKGQNLYDDATRVIQYLCDYEIVFPLYLSEEMFYPLYNSVWEYLENVKMEYEKTGELPAI